MAKVFSLDESAYICEKYQSLTYMKHTNLLLAGMAAVMLSACEPAVKAPEAILPVPEQ